MLPLEFIVAAAPRSHQTRDRLALRQWQGRVRTAAAAGWTRPPHVGPPLRLTVAYFHDGAAARVDGDNLLKPIQDALNGLVYVDDRQVTHAEVRTGDIDAAYRVRNEPAVLLAGFAAGRPFVYIRVVEVVPDPARLTR